MIEGPLGESKARLLRELVALARRENFVIVEHAGYPEVATAAYPAVQNRTAERRAFASAVTALMTDLLDAVPGPELLGLITIAGSDLGAIADLATALRNEGAIATDGGTARLVAPELPACVRSRVERQLRAVSPGARHLVQVASAVGRSFGLLDLADLLGDTAAALVGTVEEALSAGLLVGGGEMLGFGHELVRRAVAESLPLPIHRALRDDVRRRRGRRPATRRPKPAETAPLPAAGSTHAGWRDLTATEQNITRLIGEGLTNRQIATRVFLSPHTVNYHLRRIFTKLGVNSRVQLARFAQTQEPGQ